MHLIWLCCAYIGLYCLGGVCFEIYPNPGPRPLDPGSEKPTDKPDYGQVRFQDPFLMYRGPQIDRTGVQFICSGDVRFYLFEGIYIYIYNTNM